MSGRFKGEPSWLSFIKGEGSVPSFIGGFLAGSLVWSLGWAARHLMLPSHASQLKLPPDRGGDDGSDSDTESVVSESHPRRKKMVRWPWDKLRKSLSFRYPSFLNLELGSDSEASVTADDKPGPCIGEIFGMDVGGSLTKLVYFEQRQEKKREGLQEGVPASAANRRDRPQTAGAEDAVQGLWGVSQDSVPDISNGASFPPGGVESGGFNGHDDDQSKQPEKSQGGGGMTKSKSMMNLSKSTEHAEALDNFYSYARRLDTYGTTVVRDKHLSYYSTFLKGTFHFIRFETRRMDTAMNLIRYSDFHLNIKEMGATGGGAHKFSNDWDKELGIKLAKQDEMDSLVAGMQFIMADIVGECYTFLPESRVPSTGCNERNTEFEDPEAKGLLIHEDSSTPESNTPDQWWTSKKIQRDNVTSNVYPYLLVSIGTGVSILRVDGPRKQERISGSTIGGGTYWGLCRLLTGSDSFSDVLDLAMKGDPSKVDMMVGDIYGKNSNALEKIGLPSDVVASSFGKLVTKQNPSEGIKEEDLARALLLMVTNNIGQVAHLNAKLYKTSRIYFVGTFLQHNIISQQRLAYSIDYWSQGKMEAQFLEHEGYFGALGAFLLNGGIEHDSNALHNGISPDGNPDPHKKHPIQKKLHKRSKSLSAGSLFSARW